MAQIIPLTTAPNQTLNVALNIDGAVVRLTLFITFSEMAQYWLMSIYNSSGTLLLSSIPLITGSWPAAHRKLVRYQLGAGS